MIHNTNSKADDFLAKMKESRELNLKCEALLDLFNAGELSDIKPAWHTDIESIDFSKQRHELDEKLMTGDYTVEHVKIEHLLASFNRANADFFRDKTIIHSYGFADRKICRVIEHWKNGTKLIPPTILFNDLAGFNYAVDGKHRLKVAYYYGVDEIPIIIPISHLKQIMKHVRQ